MDSATIEKLESLLSKKSFTDLDAGEREFVLQQLGSADEYTSMYELNQQLRANALLKPDPQILTSLQRHMRERQRAESRFNLQWLIKARVPAPAFYLAVLGLVVALLVKRPVDIPEPQSITYVERDTVFVSASPDTVFIERVIYKKAPAVKPIEIVVNTKQRQAATESDGVSMRERQELEILLESGS